MASTAEGERLSENHRLQQLALRALIMQQLLQIWPAFDIDHILDSWPPVRAALLVLVRQGHAASAALAAQYYAQLRALEAPASLGSLPVVNPQSIEWLTPALISLEVQGAIAAKRLVALRRPDAEAQVLVRVNGSVTRSVLNGGRDELWNHMHAEKRRVGYVRLTSSHPCSFCAIIASRGVEYASKERAAFHAHDHCVCFAEPAFGGGRRLTGRNAEFRRLWNESTRGLEGDEAINAFRRAYEAPAALPKAA